MIIVGLTGSIGSGKTTFADFLASHFGRAGHWESWRLVAEVAEALRQQPGPQPEDIAAINKWLERLPEIIENACHKSVDFSQIELDKAIDRNNDDYAKLFQYLELTQKQPELQVGPINESRKESLRSILQWLGGYLAKTCGGDIWYAEIIRRIRAQPEPELATIGGVRFLADAVCIKSAEGIIIGIVRPGWEIRDKNDPTERERTQIVPDSVIHNDGTPGQLGICAGQVAADLQAGLLLSDYHARAF